MTEETQQNNAQGASGQPQNDGVNISLEQILAAILNQSGAVTISLDNLIANYANKQISVNQNEDQSVVFALVDIPQQLLENSQDSTVSGE